MNNEYELQYTTVWDFKDRGSWASHKGDYPGNWSPHVPRNLILKYSKEKDLILDQFCGSGTTLIEASLLNRRAIGCDVNEKAISTSNNRLNSVNKENIILLNRDARDLYDIKDNSIDLICTHPPYANIIKYSNNIKNDLSLLNILEFYQEMKKVSNECYRLLKDKKYCAILMGDTRKNGCVIPLGFNIMNIFMNSGFTIKEIIIKKQHNCKSTEYWKKICIKKNFHLIAHEYLFIFIKNS